MKRLLLAPLLIALTGCSNDLSVKTNVGEKYIVKNSSVEVLPFKWKSTHNRDYEIPFNELPNKPDTAKFYKCLESAKRFSSQAEIDYFSSNCLMYDKRIKPQGVYKKLYKKDIGSIVYFTPIYVDLNGNKIVLPRDTVTCYNPEYTAKYKSYIEKIMPPRYSSSSWITSKAICNKYAKF
ncbi:hypothetical protein [Prochlorococcus marinus]|uniref:hypothetical protein n=1 Tax=Prochlorococcus marinus TaxID=1219 RepID=UPI0022B38FC8|nr:hypothetical protein [Prochlorococcus marinus]